MKALTFKNTNMTPAGWSSDLHLTLSQGYAYSLPTHCAFLCGDNSPNAGFTYMEKNVTIDLKDWCMQKFGAIDFRTTEHDVGIAIDSVWRPGLFTARELQSALAFDDKVLSRSSQALRLLVERLDDILLFIEPDSKHLGVYGHKTRDLLISACTEVENYFQHYMQLAGATPISGRFFTIKDYVRLQPKLFLNEFEIEMHAYSAIGSFAPFKDWDATNFILPWYDAYNKTKHHRDSAFSEASLMNCINAIGACLVLYSVRYGPTWWASNFINSPIPDTYRLFRQPAYKGDPCKVYIPMMDFPAGANRWWLGDHSGRNSWTTTPFSL